MGGCPRTAPDAPGPWPHHPCVRVMAVVSIGFGGGDDGGGGGGGGGDDVLPDGDRQVLIGVEQGSEGGRVAVEAHHGVVHGSLQTHTYHTGIGINEERHSAWTLRERDGGGRAVVSEQKRRKRGCCLTHAHFAARKE